MLLSRKNNVVFAEQLNIKEGNAKASSARVPSFTPLQRREIARSDIAFAIIVDAACVVFFFLFLFFFLIFFLFFLLSFLVFSFFYLSSSLKLEKMNSKSNRERCYAIQIDWIKFRFELERVPATLMTLTPPAGTFRAMLLPPARNIMVLQRTCGSVSWLGFSRWEIQKLVVDCWRDVSLPFETVSRRSARPQLSVFRDCRCSRPPWRVTSTRTNLRSCISFLCNLYISVFRFVHSSLSDRGFPTSNRWINQPETFYIF